MNPLVRITRLVKNLSQRAGARSSGRRRTRRGECFGTASESLQLRVLPAADLIAHYQRAPSRADAGDRIQLNFALENIGDTNTPRFWHYTQHVEDLNGNHFGVLDDSIVPDLRPGRPIVLAERVNLPASLPDGVYRIVLTVDSGGQVSESNEANNTAFDEIIIGDAGGGTGGSGSEHSCDDAPGDTNDQHSEAGAFGSVTTAETFSFFSIEHLCDVDMFSVDVSERQLLSFDLDVSASDELIGRIRLFDSEGQELRTSAFGTAPDEAFSLAQAAKDAYFEHVFDSTGRFFIGVSAKANSAYDSVSGTGDVAGADTGDYSLTVRNLGFVPISPQPGSVSGTLYDDLNENGERNAGEPGMPDIRVFIDQDGDGIFDVGEPSSVTDADGDYRFFDVPPGAHTFIAANPGYRQTTRPHLYAGSEYRILATRDRVGELPDLVELSESGSSVTQVAARAFTSPMDYDPILEYVTFAGSRLIDLDPATGATFIDEPIVDEAGSSLLVDSLSVSPDGLLYALEFSEKTTLYNVYFDDTVWRAAKITVLPPEFDNVVEGAFDFGPTGRLFAAAGHLEDTPDGIVIRNRIYEIDPSDGTIESTLTTLPVFSDSLEATPDGRLYSLTTQTDQSRVIGFDSGSGLTISDSLHDGLLVGVTSQITGLPNTSAGGGWTLIVRSDEHVTAWDFGLTADENAGGSVPVISGPVTFTTPDARQTTEWSRVSGAVSYEIRYDRPATGEEGYLTAVVSGTQYSPEADLPMGELQVMVRANLVTGEQSAWSAPVSMTVRPRTQFVGHTPSVRTAQPIWEWEPVAGALHYDVWVTNVTTGESPYLRDQSVSDTSFTPPEPLPIGRYQIYVRAIGAGAYATQWSGVSQRVAATAAVTELTGEGGTFAEMPEYRWDPVAGAATYDLWVRQVFPVYRDQIVRQTSLTAPEYASVEALPYGRYVWWVRAVGAGGFSSDWTAPNTFWTGGRSSLTAPAVTVSDPDPLFEWTMVAGAAEYELYVSRQENSAVVVHAFGITARNYTHSSALGAGTYRAWVRAIATDSTPGVWSPVREFTIT